MKTITNIIPALALFAIACFAPLPTTQAKLPNPKPDGDYPGGNTAEGGNALFNLTTGGANTAIGFEALQSNTTGNFNTAIGFEALQSNTTANSNTAIGFQALLHNTAQNNTATGNGALTSNTTGNSNTANGYVALQNNTTGSSNTAMGFFALFENTTGFNNTANGLQALDRNTTGDSNTATGLNALYSNTTGNNNTANGTGTLQSNTTGSSNIALGGNAGLNLTTGSNNIDIFDPGVAAESNTIRIGTQGTQATTFIAGIFGETTSDSASSVAVMVDTNGNLGTVASSERFKKDIKTMDQSSEAILRLRPVTFHYKKDSKGTAQFGLVAEEVAKVNPDLVVRDENGEIYTVRYDAVNAMLLNEFLKEHHTVTELKDLAQKQQAMIGQQQKQIEALTAGLQKVGAAVAAQTGELRTAAAQP